MKDYVRCQVIDFLSKLQPGPRMAIFLLSSKLSCLQGFTSDTSALLAAINDPRNGLKVQHDPLLQTRDDRARAAEAISELQAMEASGFAIEAIRSALETVGNRQFTGRAEVTYEALMSLGRSLSGVPGRKNLIWFAGSFPLVVFPTPGLFVREERDPGVPGYVNRVSIPMIMDRVKKTTITPSAIPRRTRRWTGVIGRSKSTCFMEKASWPTGRATTPMPVRNRPRKLALIHRRRCCNSVCLVLQVSCTECVPSLRVFNPHRERVGPARIRI